MKQPDSIDVGTQMDVVRHRLNVAREDLETAHLTFEAEQYRGANNRAYYSIFHNQNQTKTLNENYYLNSLCTLTYCLFRPSKFQEHIVLFSIIIYLLYQNKCFCDFL